MYKQELTAYLARIKLFGARQSQRFSRDRKFAYQEWAGVVEVEGDITILTTLNFPSRYCIISLRGCVEQQFGGV